MDITMAELKVEDITLDYLGAIEGQPNLSAVAAYGTPTALYVRNSRLRSKVAG
jgi:hypothetical protein